MHGEATEIAHDPPPRPPRQRASPRAAGDAAPASVARPLRAAPRRSAASCRGLTRKAFEKYGFSAATLITDWPHDRRRRARRLHRARAPEVAARRSRADGDAERPRRPAGRHAGAARRPGPRPRRANTAPARSSSASTPISATAPSPSCASSRRPSQRHAAATPARAASARARPAAASCRTAPTRSARRARPPGRRRHVRRRTQPDRRTDSPPDYRPFNWRSAGFALIGSGPMLARPEQRWPTRAAIRDAQDGSTRSALAEDFVRASMRSRRAALSSASAWRIGLARCDSPRPRSTPAQAERPDRGPGRRADEARPTCPTSCIGNADAPVTVVEYASMTCGHCAALPHQGAARAQDEVHRHRQGALHLPRVPARQPARLRPRCWRAAPAATRPSR